MIPIASKVVVTRKGERFPAIARYEEYVGTTRNGDPTQMWKTKPAVMLAKCAEALALRKAFPQDLSGIYAPEELDRDAEPAEEPLQQVSVEDLVGPPATESEAT